MFRDTSVTDHDPTLPTASRRRPWNAEDICEPEPPVVICFVCASARGRDGAWGAAAPLERLLAGDVTHALCTRCLERRYPEPAPRPALAERAVAAPPPRGTPPAYGGSSIRSSRTARNSAAMS